MWIRGVTVAPVAVIVVSGLPESMNHQRECIFEVISLLNTAVIVDSLRAYIPKMTANET